MIGSKVYWLSDRRVNEPIMLGGSCQSSQVRSDQAMMDVGVGSARMTGHHDMFGELARLNHGPLERLLDPSKHGSLVNSDWRMDCGSCRDSADRAVSYGSADWHGRRMGRWG